VFPVSRNGTGYVSFFLANGHLIRYQWDVQHVVLAVDIDEDEQLNLVDYAYVGRDWFSHPVLRSIMVVSCHPDDEGIFFGGMYNSLGSLNVTNCTFTANVTADGGDAGDRWLFAGDHGDGGDGAGMYNLDSSSPTVTNCVLWDDTPSEIADDGTSSTTVNYSDVQGGWGGMGNINDDPFFVDAASGDLRLSSYASPCVDTGTFVLFLPATDLAGNPRVADGDCNTTDIVDMAASDLILGKTGGLTTSEALAQGLGFVIVDPIPGQEQRNADHLLE